MLGVVVAIGDLRDRGAAEGLDDRAAEDAVVPLFAREGFHLVDDVHHARRCELTREAVEHAGGRVLVDHPAMPRRDRRLFQVRKRADRGLVGLRLFAEVERCHNQATRCEKLRARFIFGGTGGPQGEHAAPFCWRETVSGLPSGSSLSYAAQQFQ